MSTFPERIALCVEIAGGQTAMARRVSDLLGKPITAQAIQYLANQKRATPATKSGLTPMIARVAGVDVHWLSTGRGVAAPLSRTLAEPAPVKYTADAPPLARAFEWLSDGGADQVFDFIRFKIAADPRAMLRDVTQLDAAITVLDRLKRDHHRQAKRGPSPSTHHPLHPRPS